MDSNSLWSRVIGQKDAIEKIVQSLENGGPNHAWLFTGPKGVGKWTTAKIMAAALNCDGGCGECPSCRKVVREIHPDVFLIEPEGNFILIEQIRQLLQSVSLKNFEGRTKAIIIDEADRLTPDAANALLKTLEEPPAGVVFILVSSNPEGVLPTITSRCRQVQFKSIPAQEMVSFLMREHGLEHERASLATRLSGGILGVAVSFATSSARRDRRKAILKVAEDIDRADVARVSFLAEEFMREIKRPLDELKAKQKAELKALKDQFSPKDNPKQLINRLEQRHKREATREEHQGFEEILNILVSWYRDIVLFKETEREDLLTNQDRILAVKEHVDLVSSEDAYRCLEIIEQTKQYSRFNVNMQLAFESMLLKLHDVVAVSDSSYAH